MVPMATQPKGRCVGGATTRQSPDTQGRSPTAWDSRTAPAPRYLEPGPEERGGATDHHHPTPGTPAATCPRPRSRRPLTQTRPGGQTPWLTHPCATCGPLVPRGTGRVEAGPYCPNLFPGRTTNHPRPPAGGHWGTVGLRAPLPEPSSPPGPGGCGVGSGVQGPGLQTRTAGQPSHGTLGKAARAVPPLRWRPHS